MEKPNHVLEASTVILIALLTTLRRSHSPKWCQNKLVGPMRALVGEGRTIEHVVPMLPGKDKARVTAAKILETHCRVCAGCPLGW